MGKTIEEILKSNDKVVEDTFGIVWYRFPMVENPCSEYCPFYDREGGNNCGNFLMNPISMSASFVYYCATNMKVAKNYNIYLIPIDIPEKLLLKQ